MKNKQILSTFAILSIALLSVGMVSAFGYGQGIGQGKAQAMSLMIGQDNLSEEEIAEMQQFQDSIQTTIEKNNFEEWKSLMESQLTQEYFDQLVERHSEMSEQIKLQEQVQNAWENEDYETLKELRSRINEEFHDKGQFKANCQGDCEGNFMRGERQGFFNKFRFW